MRGAFHLLDGVDGRQTNDGGAMLDDGIDGPVDRRRIDQRPHRIVHQQMSSGSA